MMIHEYGWGMWWMVIFWLVVVVAIVGIVAALVRNNSSSGRQSAENILRERFARGEITREQYEDQLRILRSK